MRLKELRISKNLTQQELSEFLGVAPNTLSQWERCLRNPDIETIKLLAEFFNVSTDYILGNTSPLAKNLKKYRDEKNVSIEELSKQTGLPIQEILDMESSKITSENANPKSLDRIAEFFDFTVDFLIGNVMYPNSAIMYKYGEDKKNNLPPLNQKDEKDISVALDKILNNLESEEALSFYGEPMDEHTKELIKLSLENSMKMAKQMAKKKFTPKKYR